MLMKIDNIFMVKKFNEFVNESVNSNIIDEIIKSGIFNYNVGSSNQQIKYPTEEDIIEAVEEIIVHEFFDADFYLNYSNRSEEYKKSFELELKPLLLDDIDKFFSDWMVVSWKTEFYKRNYKTWEIDRNKKDDIRKIIGKHINNSKIIPSDVKFEYNLYRWDYAGEKTDTQKYDYLGKFPKKHIIEK